MIIGVAILKDSIIYALPRPARHPHLFAEYNEAQRDSAKKLRGQGVEVPSGWQLHWPGWLGLGNDGVQGFVDERGNFLTRAQAANHAVQCGQVQEMARVLTSEDLW